MFSVKRELKLKGYEDKSTRPTLHTMVKMYKNYKQIIICRMYKIVSFRVEVEKRITKQEDIEDLQIAFNRVKEDVEEFQGKAK